MSVPIAEIVELAGPAHRQVGPANVAVTPGLHSEDEDEKGKEREYNCEGEEEEGECGDHGILYTFRTHS